MLFVVAKSGHGINIGKVLREAPLQIVIFSLGMYLFVYGLRNAELTEYITPELNMLADRGLWAASFCKEAIREGRLIAVCGVVGSGKTVTLRRLQQQLMDENKIIVARSLSVDKQSVRLATLINALFYDLAQVSRCRSSNQRLRGMISG